MKIAFYTLGCKVNQYDTEAMRELFEHAGWETVPFERIRRITGYLVGTLDRFNNGKRAEEADRVKHGIG